MIKNIILIRSMALGKDMWSRQIDFLKTKGYNVYNYDYAISDKMGDFVAGLEKFYKENNIGKASLVGCSLGGMISMAYAEKHPEKVDKLVLSNTAPGFVKKRDWAMWKLAQQTFRFLPKEFMKKFATLLAVKTKDLKKRNEFQKYFDKAWEKGGREELILNAQAILDFAFKDKLKNIKVPTMIMTGSFEFPMIKYGRMMVHQIPDSKLMILENTGHIANIDRSKLFNSNVLHFLKPRKLKMLKRKK